MTKWTLVNLKCIKKMGRCVFRFSKYLRIERKRGNTKSKSCFYVSSTCKTATAKVFFVVTASYDPASSAFPS